MLYIERRSNAWGIRFLFIGLIIFLASWQLIKIFQYHEVKKAGQAESRRLITLISARLMTEINDIRLLYSTANHQNHPTYQSFVGYLNDYFRKMHALESISFYYNSTADQSTSFYNPYNLKSSHSVSKSDCDIMIKNIQKKVESIEKCS